MAIKYNPSTIFEKEPSEHGIYYLADNPQLYEIQRSNNYELIVTNINNIIKAGFEQGEANSTIKNA